MRPCARPHPLGARAHLAVAAEPAEPRRGGDFFSSLLICRQSEPWPSTLILATKQAAIEAAVICRASGARLSTQHFLGNLRIGSSQRAVTPALVVAMLHSACAYALWCQRCLKSTCFNCELGLEVTVGQCEVEDCIGVYW